MTFSLPKLWWHALALNIDWRRTYVTKLSPLPEKFDVISHQNTQNRIAIDYHYCDVIMGTIASQITSFTIVYSTVYSGADQKIPSKLRVTGLCVGNSPGTGEFPAQMASNAENVSIWWRHHVIIIHYWQVRVLTVIALLGISITVPPHKVLKVLTEQGLGRSPYSSSWILNSLRPSDASVN